MDLRVGILVVAYNAASTLAGVLDRIPEDLRPRIAKILVGDDHSSDATYLVGLGYQQLSDLPIEVVRHPRNLGYGGNQKAGYQWAIDNGLDVVVLLHGDGQYAPELLPDLIRPIEEGEADAVLGSRMMRPKAARDGGMPYYKWLGNRILTRLENKVVGVELSEWHSGYRAYRTSALRAIPFHHNDDGFNFDTQVIVQLVEGGHRITEVPIPTYYGDEICYVNGLGYARDVTRDVLRYRAHKIGFGTGELAFATTSYELKDGLDSSHQRVADWVASRPPGRVLDLGCADGSVGARLRAAGHHVTGVDVEAADGAKERLDRFIQADLDHGLPPELDDRYDVVVCADVLEHVRRPDRLLRALTDVLAPGGVVIASVPNFGHWYPRLRVASGHFDYDRRGILDQDHVRFFTQRSFERLATQAGYRLRRRESTGLPLEVVERGSSDDSVRTDGSRARHLLHAVDRLGMTVRPTLFSYQFLYELAPAP